MRFKAQVRVTLKESILDPQGSAVKRALHAMNHDNVLDVRIGKHIELVLTADGPESARRQVQEIADRLLANPVIENFSFDLAEAGGEAG
ncbi:MAG: phosphoribosylformylglycinamidine synthase subunit PurS [Bacillota bacterium]|nr:phosphoribosylformylglycinamidine synthase subunit PurS [Bacillota bacterium]MDI6638230.1 phosphoribosylformylglycinamidine synthase subunit PurS [Bacillota bacterium]